MGVFFNDWIINKMSDNARLSVGSTCEKHGKHNQYSTTNHKPEKNT